jgi:hypothetical protein
MHDPAGQIDHRVDKRVGGTTILGLHVVEGVSDANVRVEAEIHGFPDLSLESLEASSGAILS